MRPRILALLLCFVISLTSLLADVRAAGVGVSVPGHVDGTTAARDTLPFFPHRPGLFGSRMRRDLEFSLSANYSRNRGDATFGLTTNDLTTLRNFGKTLVDTTSNPFNAPYPDLWLVHDYFKGSPSPYNPTPALGPGFVPPGNDSYPTADRSHIDLYIFPPGLAGLSSGHQPSDFRWQKEDSSTGWWSPTSNSVLEQNSTSFPGPSLSGVQDLGGTGWTRPNATANWGTIHEFQHYFNNDTGTAMNELFSTGAEVLTGALPTAAATYDVNYTWSLLADWLTPVGSGVTHTTSNYSAWRLLSAYLLTNFRNQDTTATLPPDGSSGLADDLMYRWARTSRTFTGLRTLLGNGSCYTCSQKAAFNPGGSALSDPDRLNVLLHDWRVANFVNNPYLDPDADGVGMYGYPPQIGFSPTQDVGAWHDNDPDPAAYNVVVFPAEVTARPSWTSKDTVISVSRERDGTSYPLALQPLGSEYWVIRSTNGIPGGKELVVRVAADSIYWRSLGPTSAYSCSTAFFASSIIDGRLTASLVGYTGQSDSLWDQPELAATVIGPSWVEIDSLAGEIELVLPGFGSTYDAAVLVLSAGVGPFGTLANKTGLANLGLGHHEATRYRLNLALRDTSTADFNPRALVESGLTKDHPSWSPDGTELVYTAATMPSSQIYRKPVAGGLSTLLNPGEGNQQTPDWSPRGDLVVYAEDNTDTTTVLFTFNVDTEALEPVTSGTAVDLYPSFSPNGRRIAYAHRAPGTSVWSVRRVNVNGTNDTAFVSTSHSYPISSIRWSPDGITVYYVSNAKLYGVPASGGSAAERSNVAPSLGSFDLPAGAGRLMLEELGLTRYNCNPAGFTQNFNRFVGYRRLALRDTTVSPRDSEMRFYRAGASFYSPRYSPDNRFVAYRSDQNAVGGGDLFVGQVIWDRAPVFTHAINDTSVWEGQGVTINLSATDPDGDAVSYAGAHLPSGATITNGYFLWLNPTLTGAPHYVTLRALSPGGAVTSKVFKIDIVPRPVAVSNLVAAAGRYDAAIAWSEPYQPGGEAGSYEIRYRTGSTITEVNFSSGALVPYSVAPGPQFTEHCTQPDVNSCTTYYFAMRTIRNGVPSFISNVASASTKCSGTSLVECESNGLYGGGGGGGSQRTGGLELSSAGGLAAASSSGAPTENSLLGGARGALGSDLMRLPGDAGPVEGAYRVRLRQSASNEVELDRITLASVDYDPGLEVFAGSDEVFLGSTTPVAAVRDAEGASITAFTDSLRGEPVSFRRGDEITIDLGASAEGTALVVTATGPAVAIGGDSSGIAVQVPVERGWQTVETFHPRREVEPRAFDLDGSSRVRLVFGSAARVEALRSFSIAERVRPTPLALLSAEHSQSGDVEAAVAADAEGVTTLTRGEELALAFTATEIPTGKARTLFLGARGQQRAVERVSGATSTTAQATTPVIYTFALGAARPNPTTGRVTIDYTLAHAIDTAVRIYDVTGRLARTLVDGEKEAGPHEVVWDGRTNAGAKAGPGVYFYRLDAGAFRSERKVVVIRP